MRIVVVEGLRYFLVEDRRGIHDLALKLCNERRLHGDVGTDEADFLRQVCDDMDGHSAWIYISRRSRIQIFVPEELR